MRRASYLIAGILTVALATSAFCIEPFKLDPVSQQQADSETKPLAENSPMSLIPALVEFGKAAQRTEYPSGRLKLPGLLYLPAGKGPFPAVIWNHGSEKNPGPQIELARFYTEHGFVFFLPTREGHGDAHGDYILDLQKKILARDVSAKSLAEMVSLHDRFNQNVVDAVAWMAPIDADENLVLELGGPKSKTPHPGGMNAAFADGSVECLHAEMPAAQRRALISIAGNDGAEGKAAK